MHLHKTHKILTIHRKTQSTTRVSACTSSMMMCETPSRPRPISPRAVNCAAEMAAPAARAPSPSNLYKTTTAHNMVVIGRVENTSVSRHPSPCPRRGAETPTKAAYLRSRTPVVTNSRRVSRPSRFSRRILYPTVRPISSQRSCCNTRSL